MKILRARYFALILFIISMCILFAGCDDSEKENEIDSVIEAQKYFFFETDVLLDNDIADFSEYQYAVRGNQFLVRFVDSKKNWCYDEQNRLTAHDSYRIINLGTGEVTEGKILYPPRSDNGVEEYLTESFMRKMKVYPTKDGTELMIIVGPSKVETVQSKLKDGTTTLTTEVVDPRSKYYLMGWNGNKCVISIDSGAAEFGEDFNEVPEIVTCDDGHIILYFMTTKSLFVISSDGKSIKRVEAPAGESGFRDSLNIRDGKPIFCRTDAGANGVTHTIYTLDCENGSFDDGVELTAEKGSTAFIIIDGYAIGYRNAQGVFGVNEKSESTMIFSWIDVGLTSAMVSNIWSIGNDEFFITYNDSIDKRTHSGIIKKSSEEEYRAFKVERSEKLGLNDETSGEDSSEKTIRVVAEPMSNVNSSAYELIQRFNRKNLDYKVKIETVDGDYESIASNLMKKMLSGDVPDVVMFGNLLRSGNFKKQNMFVDLYPFMDADKEHGRDTYLPCVLEPFEEGDGTLQLLTTEFSMNTLIGSTDTLGEIKEWTFDEMLDYAENLDGVALAYLGIPSSWSASKGFLHRMSYALLNEFIDFDGKVCNFTDGRFARLLETAKNSLFSVGTTSVADLRGIYDGEIALTLASLTGPTEYMYATGCTYFGREPVIVGYPHDEKSCGTIVFPKTQLGITKSCEDKDAAWKLLRFFTDSQVDLWNGILEDPSNFKDQEAFPCTKKAAEAMIDVSKQMYAMMMVIESKNPITGAASRSVTKTAGEKFVEKITINEDGEEVIELVESDYADPVKRAMAVNSLAGDGDGMCFYSTFDDDDAEVLWKIFNECNTVYGTNAAAVNIIVDEAEDYFSGVKSIDDVVKMVQDRVTTQINE